LTDSSRDRLARYLEGELVRSDAEALEAELAGNASLRGALEEERAFHASLRTTPEALDGVDVAAGVHARLAEPPRSGFGRRAWLAGAAAAAVAAGFVLAQLPSDFRARSGGADQTSKWTGIKIRVDGKTVDRSIARDASLVFSYTNASKTPYPYLMIFGVDASGAVRWYYPAWTDPAERPRAIRIAEGETDVLLPDAIKHPLAAGRMTIHGLFLRRPLTVEDIEKRPSGQTIADAVEHEIELMVR
jgi:hypothetical protein